MLLALYAVILALYAVLLALCLVLLSLYSVSLIAEKSTHNQRIERLWRDIYEGALSFFYQLFYFMEEESILDPLDESNLAALHYVFVPLVNAKLNIWQSDWAHHRIRTARATPAQLWLSGQINNPVGIDAIPDPVLVLDHDDSSDDGNQEQSQGERPIILPLIPSLPEACQNELGSETWTQSNHGIDDYLKALNIIRDHFN